MKANNFSEKTIYYFLFGTYFLIGLLITDDFGISVDEEFHRYSGFYWLNYVLEFTPFNNLKAEVFLKLNEIGGHTLPNPKNFPFYGVTFDLPLALIETLFNIQDSKNYFLLRHIANFSIFFIGSIFFYLILKQRFRDNKIILLGILLYLSSPRIFGHSFYNNKDIIFLSILTINFYFFFSILTKKNYKNIFLFSIFSALTCATRIVGIFIPFAFIAILLLNKNSKIDSYKFRIKTICTYIFLFLLFLILFWPYLWEDPLTNLIYSIKIFSEYPAEFLMLFDGNYIDSKYLPLSYLPIWMLITIPLTVLIFFIYGNFYLFKRLLNRTFNIKDGNFINDFWRGRGEKKDFIIFMSFNIIFFYIILSNTDLYNGWRHLYFLHFFISYIACIGLYKISLVFKKIKFLFFIILFFISLNFIQIYKFHPYQGSFFNILAFNKDGYEVDYWGLAGVKFLEELIDKNQNSEIINVGVASYLPLERSMQMIDKSLRKKIRIVGQNYLEADYIFNNNISEVNKFNNSKYKVPNNFKLIEKFSINEFLIYEMYEKK